MKAFCPNCVALVDFVTLPTSITSKVVYMGRTSRCMICDKEVNNKETADYNRARLLEAMSSLGCPLEVFEDAKLTC